MGRRRYINHRGLLECLPTASVFLTIFRSTSDRTLLVFFNHAMHKFFWACDIRRATRIAQNCVTSFHMFLLVFVDSGISDVTWISSENEGGIVEEIESSMRSVSISVGDESEIARCGCRVQLCSIRNACSLHLSPNLAITLLLSLSVCIPFQTKMAADLCCPVEYEILADFHQQNTTFSILYFFWSCWKASMVLVSDDKPFQSTC
ncbi:unnamed protein product [Albugo candida]|uniref:Uncharacterized protein n=1 Tax=Albugo candida TaxID=65357 RepID=A0A024FVC2_9STRA|nr:unnamed protein product [Albugo candida]|eukprot:CCI11065.1 unnamed protein product [Albugo candida]